MGDDLRESGEAIRRRYEGLAALGENLSCGGALEAAAPAPGEVLLDLGSGRGGDVLRAARRVGPGGRAIGVDVTPGMVAAAREAARAAGETGAEFRLGRLEALPVETGTVNVIVSNCALNHAEDAAAVWREVFRVLRPGGRAVVADIVAEQPVPAAIRSDPEARAGCYGGALTWDELAEAVGGSGLEPPRVLSRSASYERGGVALRKIVLVVGKRPG